jgi:hypothetical protein
MDYETRNVLRTMGLATFALLILLLTVARVACG